jgi:hypothetical protein
MAGSPPIEKPGADIAKINLGKAVWRATFVGNEFPAEIC